jgi:sulfite reductase alpha subunit-like flavoprotein
MFSVLGMKEGVRRAWLQILQKSAGMSPAQAEEELQKWTATRRYMVEVWG